MMDLAGVDAQIAAVRAEHDQLAAAVAAGEDVTERWAGFERRRADLERGVDLQAEWLRAQLAWTEAWLVSRLRVPDDARDLDE